MSTHSRDWRGRPDRSLHVSAMSLRNVREVSHSLLFSSHFGVRRQTRTLVLVRPTLEASAVGAAWYCVWILRGDRIAF